SNNPCPDVGLVVPAPELVRTVEFPEGVIRLKMVDHRFEDSRSHLTGEVDVAIVEQSPKNQVVEFDPYRAVPVSLGFVKGIRSRKRRNAVCTPELIWIRKMVFYEALCLFPSSYAGPHREEAYDLSPFQIIRLLKREVIVCPVDVVKEAVLFIPKHLPDPLCPGI